MRRILLPLLVLALPFVEIAGFVIVGREIGVLATIGFVLLSAVVGSVLMRWQGFGVMARIRRDMAAGKNPGRELAHGVMILIAGVLLLIPGFATDAIGLILFLPPVRELGWRLVRDRVRTSGSVKVFSFGAGGNPARGGKTIDLEEDDYSTSNTKTPWRPIDRDR